MLRLRKLSGLSAMAGFIMNRRMSVVRLTENQVFNSIISSNSVDMVNYFKGVKKAFEFLFHNKAMFAYIFIFSLMGVGR